MPPEPNASRASPHEQGTASGWAWLGPGPVILALAVLGLLWLASGMILLLFAAVLMGVALRGLAVPISAHTRLPAALGPLLIMVVVLALGVTAGIGMAPDLTGQFDNLGQRLSEFRDEAATWLGGFGWLSDMAGFSGSASETAARTAEVAAQAGMVTLGVLMNLVLIVVLGLFLASTPKPYLNGTVRLVPIQHRPRAREILARAGSVLRWWMLGQLVSMAVLGSVTAVGLWLFSIPFWLPLALITAVFTFVPFLGPLAAGALIVAVSLSQGMETTLQVLALYVVLQNLEGMVLTPMVQQQAVHIPPATLIAAQVMLGALFGLPGLLLAAPLAALGLVLVKMLYVEDVLGDRSALND